MKSCVPDESTVQRLSAEINACTPRPHHASLLAVIERLMPACSYRFALTRGGWYRPGGLIRADGERLADHLETWVTQELVNCDDDMGEFMDRHADSELLATRHMGHTHYFVAAYGHAPADFLQMEVEELQEVLDRRLWDAASPPSDAQELTDPIMPARVPAQVVGAPHYCFRRLTDMRKIMARLPAAMRPRAPFGAPLSRFMQEWVASRAGAKEGGAGKHFSECWVIALREQHDSYNNVVISAKPVAQHARQLKTFHWNINLHGLESAQQLQAFDRAAGYLGAWYFHLVAGGLTPRAVAFSIMQDIDSGFGYLGDLELALLQGWIKSPYSV
jgi:hypothetical protein